MQKRATGPATDGGGSGISAPLVDEIASWIMASTLGQKPLDEIYGGVCERLFAAGVPVARAHISFGVLHPLYSGFSHTWRRGGGLQTEGFTRPGPNDAVNEMWMRSPLYYVITNDLPFLRRRLTGRDAVLDFPFLEEMREQGATDYFAYAIRFGGGEFDGMAGSWTTDRPSGFTDADIIVLRRIQQRIGVACKMRIKDQIAENVVTTYLGRDAGLRVLSGQIRRGDGEWLRAVFWYSDLRGSTRLAGSLDAHDFITLLNSYFEVTAGAVTDNGGEILSFVGDAVLAAFPTDGDAADAACARATAAQADAAVRLAALNRDLEARGREPLRYGLGLHLGDAVFGNIGVPERLAFTVIGAPVNEVARLEQLTKTLGEPVIASAEFADHAGRTGPAWRSIGRHELRGVAEPVELFAPPE